MYLYGTVPTFDNSVSDPYTFYTDPDPGILSNKDPGPAPDPGKKNIF